ncbi:MAG: phosphoenolpyruvate--protein phosphotransferase [Elusimicrobiales bacterium]
MIIMKGIPASPGIAIGKAYVFDDNDLVIDKRVLSPDAVKNEVKRFKDAVRATLSDLDAAEAKVLLMLGKKHAKLIETHRLILKDPLITQEVPRRIAAELVNAEYALSQTIDRLNRNFEKIDDEFFRERRHDLFDVGKRLVSHLVRQEKRSLADIKVPSVLIAHNLYPSDTLHMRESRVLGFCTDIGGKTSHTALLAQSMELPAVVGLSDITRQVRTGDVAIVDGDRGLVIISPGPEALEKYQKTQRQQRQAERFLETVRQLPSVTRDGHKINLLVNMDMREDPQSVTGLNVDGVGLLRTEWLYMNRPAPPPEEEQFSAYDAVAKALAPAPVTIRLADIGGDKLTALGIPGHENETNPFMGLRGVRLFLQHSDMMRTQLRASLRAAKRGNVKIMIPMVTSASEVRAVRMAMEEMHSELVKEGRAPQSLPELGIMVEIPSAALTLDTMLSVADFISIGTNDLIQYLLAVDRVNQRVAHIYDTYHPAVLRVLHLIVQTAHKKGKQVSVCGEMASDPKAACLLAGLGMDALSVTPRMFLKVKHTIRSLDFTACAQAAQQALTLSSCEEIRQLVLKTADENP